MAEQSPKGLMDRHADALASVVKYVKTLQQTRTITPEQANQVLAAQYGENDEPKHVHTARGDVLQALIDLSDTLDKPMIAEEATRMAREGWKTAR